MKNFFGKVAFAASGLGLSSLAVAQDATTQNVATGNVGLISIGAAIAVGMATFGAASAQGRTATTALEGIARNPNAKDAMFQPFILGLVFMEFQALLGFVIAILWTFK